MKKNGFNYCWFVIAILFIINFFAAVNYACIPPMFAEITKQLPLTKAQMGSVMGAVVLASIVFSPLGGGLSDRFGCRLGIGAGILITAIGGTLRAFVTSGLGLSALMFVTGAGIFIVISSCPKVLGLWFSSDQLAFVNGVCWAGFGFGGAFGTATAASLLSPVLGGWRIVMLILGGASLCSGIIWVFFYREPNNVNVQVKNEKNIIQGFRNVLKVADVRMLAFFICFQALGFKAISAFLPISLMERGVGHAGELTAIIYFSFLVVNIVAGIVSDKYKIRKPLIFAGSVASGLSVFGFSSLTGVPLILSLALCGAGAGAVIPILFTFPVEMKKIGPDLAASATGIMMMLQSIGGVFGPILSGKIIDVFGTYFPAYFFMGTAILLSTVFVFPVKETGPKKIEAFS